MKNGANGKKGKRFIRAMAAGAIGGLIGSALMGPVHSLSEIEKPEKHGADPTEKVANTLAKHVTGHRLMRSQKKTGGQVVHYAFGALLGALYGLVAAGYPEVTLGTGTVFGAAAYTGAHALAVPALGLAASPVENGVAQELPEFAAHIVYGIVTEQTRRLLA
jgi:putative membrane protein